MSEETLNIEEQVQEQLAETIENEQPQSEMTELESLISRRMGSFKVSLSLSDLKYLKNKLNDVTWTGPNEAYLQIMASVALGNEIRTLNSIDHKDTSTRHEIMLPSTTIESINFFLSRVSGKGEEGAHRLFSIAMLLRQTAEEIKNLDAEISALRNSEDSDKNEESKG